MACLQFKWPRLDLLLLLLNWLPFSIPISPSRGLALRNLNSNWPSPSYHQCQVWNMSSQGLLLELKWELHTKRSFTHKLLALILSCFADNDTTESSPLILWESHKCVMGGHLVRKVAELKEISNPTASKQFDVVANLKLSHKKCSFAMAVELRKQMEELTSPLLHHSKTQLFKAQWANY